MAQANEASLQTEQIATLGAISSLATFCRRYKLADIIDITVPLQPDMPTWPGSKGPRLTPTMRLSNGDPTNVSRLDCDLHTGTHLDAPKHVLQDGMTVDKLPLEILVGSCFVADLPEAADVTADTLADSNLPSGIERLLLRTPNSELWAKGETDFREDYAALTPDAAQWIVDQAIRLIGVDYLSVQRYGDDSTTHQILLGADTIVLEGLNLSNVQSGFYELICLPLNLLGAEAAPARAILRTMARVDRMPPAKGGQS